MARAPKQINVRCTFPYLGLNTVSPYELQPEQTTQDLQNVRSYEMTTGRRRGGQRPGSSKFITDQAGGSSSTPIQDIAQIRVAGLTRGSQAVLVSSLDSSPVDPCLVDSSGTEANIDTDENDQVWTATAPGDGYIYAVIGEEVAVEPDADYFLAVYDSAGNSALSVAVGSDGYYPLGIAVDESVIYVAWGKRTPDYDLQIYRYMKSDGSIHADDSSTFWIDGTDFTATGYAVLAGIKSGQCLAYLNSRLAVLMNADQSTTTVDSYLGIINTTDGSEVSQTHTGTSYTCSATSRKGVITDGLGSFYHWTSNSTTTMDVDKIRASDGNATWSIQDTSTTDTGIQCLAYDWITDRVFAVGSDVRKTGHNFGLLSVGAGAVSSNADKVDANAWQWVGHRGDGGYVILRDATGSNLYSYQDDLTTSDWNADLGYSTDYGYQRTAAIDAGVASASSQVAGSLVGVSVCNGHIERFAASGFSSPATSSNPELEPSTRQIFSVPFLGVLYLTDGQSYVKYDASTDTVAAWTAVSGSLPVDSNAGTTNCPLIEVYANRVLLAGVSDDKTNLWASRIGNATDWDDSPATISVDDPFVLNNVNGLGKLSDVINGIVPYTNDTCLLGGDHSFHMLSGNPLEGGRLDVVTEITGIAWGRAWCYGPGGRVFFFGSRGGVYMLVPSARHEPVSLTDQSIEEDLRAVDFSTTVVRLAWDDRQQGLYVWLTPTDGSAGTHYFWESRQGANKGWMKDVMPADYQPYAVLLYDADEPDDRAVLVGGQDGYIRKVDYTAANDDDTAIDAYAFVPVWPMFDRGHLNMAKMTELQATLGASSDDVTATIHRGQDAKTALEASAFLTCTLSAGRNYSRRDLVNAKAMWLKLRNNTVDEAFQTEQLSATIEMLPTTRSRMFT